MKRISKDLADQMLMDSLINFSKLNLMPSQFEEDSLNIINNEIDKSVFTGVLLLKSKHSFLEKHEDDMRITILSSLQTVYSCIREELNENCDFNADLSKELCHIDEDKCRKSTKLNFAVTQFVNAFYEYERLEKKYPELMKIM
jgi:hypothetical protein